MKTWKLTVNEIELRTLIKMHAETLCIDNEMAIETSSRIHDLTKRLNAKEKEADNNEATQQQNEAQAAAATNEPAAAKTGW